MMPPEICERRDCPNDSTGSDLLCDEHRGEVMDAHEDAQDEAEDRPDLEDRDDEPDYDGGRPSRAWQFRGGF